MTPGNLDGVHIPADADPAQVWAVGREFDMRQARYRTARLGVVGAMELATKSAKKFTEAMLGLDRVFACGPPSDCKCKPDCDFPCWHRMGIADPCTECGCAIAADQPTTEDVGKLKKEMEPSNVLHLDFSS